MKRNEGTVDRAIRVALGLGLIALVFVGPISPWVGAVGLVLLATGLIGFCPLYRVIGLHTSKAAS